MAPESPHRPAARTPAGPRSARDTATDGRPVGAALREALIDRSMMMVERTGPEGLSLRAVAEAAGASHNAPYIYFSDGVRELLAAVAVRGFDDLLAALDRAPVAAEGAARARQVVSRYVAFGVERPQVYRAMFNSRLAEPLESPASDAAGRERGKETYRALRLAKVKAYQALVAPIESLHLVGRLRPGTRPHYVGMAIGALVHGLVGEFIDEGIGGRASRETPWSALRQRMTLEVTDMLLFGLLAAPEPGGGGDGAQR